MEFAEDGFGKIYKSLMEKGLSGGRQGKKKKAGLLEEIIGKDAVGKIQTKGLGSSWFWPRSAANSGNVVPSVQRTEPLADTAPVQSGTLPCSHLKAHRNREGHAWNTGTRPMVKRIGR
jgi:hypothetical protein